MVHCVLHLFNRRYCNAHVMICNVQAVEIAFFQKICILSLCEKTATPCTCCQSFLQCEAPSQVARCATPRDKSFCGSTHYWLLSCWKFFSGKIAMWATMKRVTEKPELLRWSVTQQIIGCCFWSFSWGETDEKVCYTLWGWKKLCCHADPPLLRGASTHYWLNR